MSPSTPPPPPLETSHNVLLAAGPAPSVVRVQNIQSTIQGPHDAWGRPYFAQPISVSVAVHLHSSFGSASTSDKLTPDTVHYGLLSKAILATLDKSTQEDNEVSSCVCEALCLPEVLGRIWTDLTGLELFSSRIIRGRSGDPFLQVASLKRLEVKVCLPKASRVGGGVSLTGEGAFENGVLKMRGVRLGLHDIRVPVLIGVNKNERQAKQSVVANVEVERLDVKGDHYCGLEDVIVQAMTSSSFETVEALLGDLAVGLKGYLTEKLKAPKDGKGWHLRIAVEKPIAVVFADAPCVELSIGTNDVSR
ncbi:hypothetical protein E4U15_005285 [Claviceps sp. LM218 group G6]|nr:hypothetical protein E4U15_005285 [Claviceps sp. LM218 group G6]